MNEYLVYSKGKDVNGTEIELGIKQEGAIYLLYVEVVGKNLQRDILRTPHIGVVIAGYALLYTQHNCLPDFEKIS